jgi:Domain of unknown function (DUF1707)/Cell wall-active antibiotics response 4TMS YvqF
MTMEPSDVGPKYGGHLPVTEADRADAMTLLEAARTHGYLTTDEYEHRALAVRSAANRDDLRPVTRDLENVTQGPVTYSQMPTFPVARPSGVVQEPLVKVGFFSGATLAGKWDTPAQLHCYAAFGGVDIDFTDAVWTSDEIILDAYAVFGGVNVKVPAGVEVIDHAFAIFGGTSVKRTTPGTKRIIVKGFALFGGIDVKGPHAD